MKIQIMKINKNNLLHNFNKKIIILEIKSKFNNFNKWDLII